MAVKIVFAEEARNDLRSIDRHYRQFSELTANAVLDDLFELIDVLETFPSSGRLLANGTRRRSTRRYKYSLTYLSTQDRIEVLFIHRFQNRP